MKVKGDPWGESNALVALQKQTSGLEPGLATVARGMSHFGEHALGWMGTAALGAVVDKKRRTQWVEMGVAAFTSHAASVILKRIVRRPRPHREDIRIGVKTPSALSFPSSHATSTTAALVLAARITGCPALYVGIPAMMGSRMLLGVHYPTDVTAGALLGAATAVAVRKSNVVGRILDRGGRL
ncbi:phosphatase PAP2 family protein [Corynebacterium pyruviciproducens]|uniref:phosphatase PAP2 family protein n=1 Tax=Corynebacterium pyruviciproducens TaxID=598660 RepID=UPI003983B044